MNTNGREWKPKIHHRDTEDMKLLRREVKTAVTIRFITPTFASIRVHSRLLFIFGVYFAV